MMLLYRRLAGKMNHCCMGGWPLVRILKVSGTTKQKIKQRGSNISEFFCYYQKLLNYHGKSVNNIEATS